MQRRCSGDLGGPRGPHRARGEIVALVDSRKGWGGARGDHRVCPFKEAWGASRTQAHAGNEREVSIIIINSRRRKSRAQFLSSPNDANNTYIIG